MRVIVKGRHMSLTPALKSHAEDKLSKAIMRIFDRPATQVEIELNEIGNVRDGKDKECRVTVRIPGGKTINITEIDDDMYKAIDLAHDRIITQVKRESEKRQRRSKSRKAAEERRATIARKTLTSYSEPRHGGARHYTH